MKKGLMIAAGVVGVSLIASEIAKKMSKNKSVEEKVVDENSADEFETNKNKPDANKAKNHSESVVRVHNSLVSVKIKIFSK